MKILLFNLILMSMCWGSKSEVCPGGEYVCPADDTCCPLPGGSYGCCTYSNAVCCDDHIHCCPSGDTCVGGMCFKLHRNSTLTVDAKQLDVSCPEEQNFCPDNSTCCKHPTLEMYNCCPLANAVCCHDGQSCCPEFSSCDLEHQECVTNDIDVQVQPTIKIQQIPIPLLIESQIHSNFSTAEGVLCPGGKKECPSDNTCCALDETSQKYGCCNLPEATCCSDYKHCCPHGYRCDESYGMCIK